MWNFASLFQFISPYSYHIGWFILIFSKIALTFLVVPILFTFEILSSRSQLAITTLPHHGPPAQALPARHLFTTQSQNTAAQCGQDPATPVS